MPYKGKPKAPLLPEAKKGDEAAAAPPDKPKDLAKAVKDDKAVPRKRKEMAQAAIRIRQHLTKFVEDSDLSDVDKYVALADITAFVGELTAKLETFDAGQRTKFKLSREFKGLKIEVGQDLVVGGKEEGLGSSAKPYKLKFKVKILPLKVAFGYEQYNKKDDEPMALADKSLGYMEIILHHDDTTGVNVKFNVARKTDRTGDEKKITDSAAVIVSTGSLSGMVQFSLPNIPAGAGLPPPAVNLLLAAKAAAGEGGEVNLGAGMSIPGMQPPTVSFSAYGTF